MTIAVIGPIIRRSRSVLEAPGQLLHTDRSGADMHAANSTGAAASASTFTCNSRAGDAELFGHRAWAWSAPAPDAVSRLVLVALGEHVGADGRAWPSLTRLAEMTGLDPRTVRSRLDGFIAAGILADDGIRIGRNRVRALRVVGYVAPAWQKRREQRQPGTRHGRARPAPTTTSRPSTTTSEAATTASWMQTNYEEPPLNAAAPEALKAERPKPAPTPPSPDIRAKLAAVRRGERINREPVTSAPAAPPAAPAADLGELLRAVRAGGPLPPAGVVRVAGVQPVRRHGGIRLGDMLSGVVGDGAGAGAGRGRAGPWQPGSGCGASAGRGAA